MKVDEYVSKMASELDALRADVKKAGRPQLLPLDLSYESLDRAEDFYRLVLDKRVPGKLATVADRLVRYAGATLIENAGGEWAAGPTAAEPICVTKMKGVPKARFTPASRVKNFKPGRFVGGLREKTEAYDLPLQRGRIAELTGDVDSTIEQLRTDIEELTGSDPGALDGDLASVDRIEPAFLQVKANEASRELRRRLRAGAVIYLGHVLQSQLGKAEWEVEDGPRNSAIGAWKIFDYVLEPVLALVEPGEKGVLRREVEDIVRDRKNAKKKS